MSRRKSQRRNSPAGSTADNPATPRPRCQADNAPVVVETKMKRVNSLSEMTDKFKLPVAVCAPQHREDFVNGVIDMDVRDLIRELGIKGCLQPSALHRTTL